MAFTSNSRVMTLLRYCPYQVYSTLDRVCDEESGNTESSTIAAQLPKRDASKWTIRFCSSSRIDSIVRRAILALLPSPLSSLFGYGGPSFSSPSETAYLDGLRGIGALIVYTQHFAMPFHHGIIGDSSRETGSWSVLQYPIVRLFYHGSFAVSLFFVLSGFVLSRSILTTRHHNSSVISCTKATEAIASAAFRRGIRLFPPAIAVVFVTFILARLEAFEHPRLELPSNRYDLSTPEKLDSTIEQLGDAVTYVFSQLLYPAKWMRPVDLVSAQTYGFHLWTISVEFWASQLLFLALLATIRFTASARRQIFSLIIIYSFWCLRWELSLFLAGSLISDFHLLRETIQRSGSTVMARLIHYGVAGLCCFCGMWVGSMPDFNGEATPGFQALSWLMFAEPIWHGIGAVLVVGSVAFCEPLQAPFGLPWIQYLGKISFAVYLVHVPILSSFGWSTVGLLQTVADSQYALGGELVGFVGILIIVIWVADIFWRLVDVHCITLAKILDRKLVAG